MPNRRTLAENYDIIAWQMRIFIGGTFNMVFFFALGAYWASNLSPTGELISYSASYWVPFVVLFFFVLFSPFLMSLILSKNYPNIRTVSPFWLSLVSFAEILIAAVNFIDISGLLGLIFFDFLFLLAGYGEDRLTVKVLGIVAEQEQIYFEHLHIDADIGDVKKQLTIPAIGNRLDLSDVIEGDAEHGFLFKAKQKREENCAYKISLVRTEGNPKTTELKIVYFEKGRYALSASPDFLEWARDISYYLEGALSSSQRDRYFTVTPVVGFTNKAQDSLIDSVIEDMQGYIAKYKRVSTGERLKIAALFAFFVAAIVMFLAASDKAYAFILFGFDIFIAILEAYDRLKGRSGR